MAYRLIDPDSVLDFTISFVNLLDSGVLIDLTPVPVWTITPTGPTLANQANTTTSSTIYVSGTTVGVVYALSCKIITDAATPQTFERTIMLRCEQR